jgi:uncharacterized protein YbcC (UPF0753/DUF2309 family)
MINQQTTSMSIQNIVQQAAVSISPVWPLETFIACNPLQGFESLPFEEAITEGNHYFTNPKHNPAVARINRELIKWCGAFLDMGQGTIAMPNRDEGFYRGFLSLAIYDNNLSHDPEKKVWLKGLPTSAEDALESCLEKLKVSESARVLFLKDALSHLPGWAGYVKWRTDWRNAPSSEDKTPVTLVDFLAVRMVLTVIYWSDMIKEQPTSAQSHTIDKSKLWKMKLAEEKYQELLLKEVFSVATNLPLIVDALSDVQMVFCIDVRSEPIRSSIEKLGQYETFGFAGFFGLPVRIHNQAGGSHDACPVLLKPRHDVFQKPLIKAESFVKPHERGRQRLSLMRRSYQQLKYNISTPFSLVETLGAWCGGLMLSRTLFPVMASKVEAWLKEKIMPEIQMCSDLNQHLVGHLRGMPLEDQVIYAEAALKMMGMQRFAKLVIFCGHGGGTQNNPYASALDCGACGGNGGGPNAKLLRDILNQPAVQNELRKRGINLPLDTYFMAALHNTTTDEVILYEDDVELPRHQALLTRLKHDLEKAQGNNQQKRAKGLGVLGKNVSKDVLRRSSDWSEVRPEWGLAKNAAFIVGPRKLTAPIDLQGRCFLHSYEWAEDQNSAFLETILTAPMVVAQWINAQYLFSTLDNAKYGSGSKVTHNVAGKIGVMQGNASDLMHGLPLQSVMMNDDLPYHEPQRLLTVVYAPRQNIASLIEKQEILRKLFFNGWVHLVVIDPVENQMYQLTRAGRWELLHDGPILKDHLDEKIPGFAMNE